MRLVTNDMGGSCDTFHLLLKINKTKINKININSMRRKYTSAMAISFFVIAISLFNFTSLSGTECIRATHVVTLLVSGMGIGVFFLNLIGLLREKRS